MTEEVTGNDDIQTPTVETILEKKVADLSPTEKQMLIAGTNIEVDRELTREVDTIVRILGRVDDRVGGLISTLQQYAGGEFVFDDDVAGKIQVATGRYENEVKPVIDSIVNQIEAVIYPSEGNDDDTLSGGDQD